MADDDTNSAQAHDQPLRPNPALKSLDIMVDTWNVKGRESGPDGEIHGQVTFEWMEGCFSSLNASVSTIADRGSRVSSTSDTMSQRKPSSRTSSATTGLAPSGGLPSSMCGRSETTP